MISAKTGKPLPLQNVAYTLPPPLEQAVLAAQEKWDAAQNTARLWSGDASLWTNTDESSWLGWLDIVNQQLSDTSKFKALAAEIREDGFTHVVVLGMGGSSLCPEVFAATFGKQPNAPKLLTLDSTDPACIRRLRERIDPARTLFCVSSKSGTTLEPNIFMQYFYDETRKIVGDRAGHHFIAITDPGSPLESVSENRGFRRMFHGLPSIGSRYSALSDFGMVPHAAMGLDTEHFLKVTALMAEACRATVASQNPGVLLGLILGTAATQFKRDKVTLLCSRSVYDIGALLENLLAESTGKEGRGLIPVYREPLFASDLAVYGNDRLFAYITFVSDKDPELEAFVAALEKGRQPIVRVVLNDLIELGQVFFQWEVATAVAGSLLQVNAFNQPDIDASKVATLELMNGFEQSGALPPEQPIVDSEGLKLFGDEATAQELTQGGHTVGSILRAHLDRLNAGDYFGLLAFIPMFPEYEAKLEHIRKHIAESKNVATVLGFGPRFLHSTGQLYQGGPNSGLFLEITCDDAQDLAVPEQNYTFGVVKAAQARGDFQVLLARHRRALRLHLGADVSAGLNRLHDLVSAALAH